MCDSATANPLVAVSLLPPVLMFNRTTLPRPHRLDNPPAHVPGLVSYCKVTLVAVLAVAIFAPLNPAVVDPLTVYGIPIFGRYPGLVNEYVT